MNICELEQHIKEYNLSKDPLWEGVDYENDCVDYDTAALLFDWHFNEPCLTYFHNEDDLEGYPEGSPERAQWEGREWNWEMCMHGTFLNYPDNFVVRCRYARPTCIQVLQWMEKEFGMKFFVGTGWITIQHLPKGLDRNNRVLLELEFDDDMSVSALARSALKLVIDHMR